MLNGDRRAASYSVYKLYGCATNYMSATEGAHPVDDEELPYMKSTACIQCQMATGALELLVTD